jgi:hypothetical protein
MSSDLLMQILRAFRSNPWRGSTPYPQIFLTAKFFDLSIVKKPMAEEVEKIIIAAYSNLKLF